MGTIAVIGGGVSGMTAAAAAARKDRRAGVYILEHNDSLGKKILSTGNGRCNLTNRNMSAACFRGGDQEIVEAVLRRFGGRQTEEFFHSVGVLTHARGDYVYPRSEQAADVRESLQMELARLRVGCHMNEHVKKIRKEGQGFIIESGGKQFRADKVILACGSRASKIAGSDGSGYTLARELGHTLEPVVPALVQLKVRGNPFAKAAGVRTEAGIAAIVGGREAASDTGELQITSYGVSGIPVFQVSRFISRGLYEKRRVQTEIDFLPEMSLQETERLFIQRRQQFRGRSAGEFLTGVFSRKLIPRLLELAGIRLNTPAEGITPKQLKSLSYVCKRTVLDIEDTNGFEQAQICAGGVKTSEICPDTMESLLMPGVYIVGELMDVDGMCGGYNITYAVATGYIAGCHAADAVSLLPETACL